MMRIILISLLMVISGCIAVFLFILITEGNSNTRTKEIRLIQLKLDEICQQLLELHNLKDNSFLTTYCGTVTSQLSPVVWEMIIKSKKSIYKYLDSRNDLHLALLLLGRNVVRQGICYNTKIEYGILRKGNVLMYITNLTPRSLYRLHKGDEVL